MNKYNITKGFLIKEYIKNKKSQKQIAKEVGCSTSPIKDRLIKYNIPRRTRSEANLKYPQGYKSIYPICKCGKRVSNPNNTLCKGCYLEILRNKRPHNYKGGMPKCIDCEKQLGRYDAIRCRPCARINSWKNEEYRINTIKAQREGMKLKPNKPEKLLNNLLNKLFPKEYKFIGDGKVILDGFSPDFINCNGQKKIIELYGCYWHKCSQCNFGNKRILDKQRIKSYAKYGYKTLIVWEHELKDLKLITAKILEFNNDKN